LTAVEFIDVTGGLSARIDLGLLPANAPHYILGDTNDRIDFDNGGIWTATGTTVVLGTTFTVYTEAGGDQLFVDSDIVPFTS
jgi:hypothetical protein